MNRQKELSPRQQFVANSLSRNSSNAGSAEKDPQQNPKTLDEIVDLLKNSPRAIDQIETQEMEIAKLTKDEIREGSKYLEIIVTTELDMLGVKPEDGNYARLKALLLKVASTSAEQYPVSLEEFKSLLLKKQQAGVISMPEIAVLELFDIDSNQSTSEQLAAALKAQQDKAIKDASEPGIAAAQELIAELEGKPDVDLEEIRLAVSKVTLESLKDQVTSNISTILGEDVFFAPIEFDDFELYFHLVNAINSLDYTSLAEKALMIKIAENSQVPNITESKNIASTFRSLMIAATAVHISWSGIQARRSIVEQSELLEEYFKAADNSDERGNYQVSVEGVPTRLTNTKFAQLRIFRDSVATLPAMVVGNFASRYENAKNGDKEDTTALYEAVAYAILEILKDLVKIAKPEIFPTESTPTQ